MLHRTNPTCKETGVKEVKGSLQQRSQLFANLMAGRSDGEAMKPDIIYGKGKGAEKNCLPSSETQNVLQQLRFQTWT